MVLSAKQDRVSNVINQVPLQFFARVLTVSSKEISVNSMSIGSLYSFEITVTEHFTKLLSFLDKVQANQNDFLSSSCHSVVAYEGVAEWFTISHFDRDLTTSGRMYFFHEGSN